MLCSKKLGTPVPRLDLTPVLASMAAEQQTVSDRDEHQGPLLLEDAPRPRRLELDGDTDSVHDTHSGTHTPWMSMLPPNSCGGKPCVQNPVNTYWDVMSAFSYNRSFSLLCLCVAPAPPHPNRSAAGIRQVPGVRRQGACRGWQWQGAWGFRQVPRPGQ